MLYCHECNMVVNDTKENPEIYNEDNKYCPLCGSRDVETIINNHRNYYEDIRYINSHRRKKK